MMRWAALFILPIGLALIALRAHVVDAQQSRELRTGAEPVSCYRRASDAGLERLKALRLCVGASSDAPARCFDEAVDRIGLSDLQGIRLCRAATSIAPATCAERLDDRGFEDLEIVDYCAALRWPLVPPGTMGTPACVQAGLDRTSLTEPQVIRLCRGSSSSASIDCFEIGDDTTLLSDRDLVALCAPVVIGTPGRLLPY
jgi:hypothetical protein